MEGTVENRAARDIVATMGEKVLFAYIPEMEISVPESDRKNSLDKIACYYHDEQFVLSDLYIGYAVSLYRYTIPIEIFIIYLNYIESIYTKTVYEEVRISWLE